MQQEMTSTLASKSATSHIWPKSRILDKLQEFHENIDQTLFKKISEINRLLSDKYYSYLLPNKKVQNSTAPWPFLKYSRDAN